jgi:hypothetical protein
MLRCGLKSDGRWYIGQNLSFMICLSYPALVVVPVTVSDEVCATVPPANLFFSVHPNRPPAWESCTL